MRYILRRLFKIGGGVVIFGLLPVFFDLFTSLHPLVAGFEHTTLQSLDCEGIGIIHSALHRRASDELATNGESGI